MEVNMLNTNGYPTVNRMKIPEETAINVKQFGPELQSQKVKSDVPEKVMMDFKDVQTFLYLLIGAHIAIDENPMIPGKTVDTSA